MTKMLFCICAFLLAGLADLQARTYYLPDYQQAFIYGKRVDQIGTGTAHTPTLSCSTYGYYSAENRPDNASCRSVSFPGLTCYSCTVCDAQYQYDSSNCSDPYVLSGAICNGKYARCICDTSVYTATYESGCPAGQKIDTSASCSGPSDTTTYYKCVDDPCAAVTGLDCEFGCEIYYENCPDKCQKCQDDNCPAREAVDTPYGCEKYWDDCATKCEVAKSCPTNDCSAFPLSSCPPNSICESCTVGCGDDIVHYRQIGCKTGYFKPALYWCMNKPFC